MTDITIPSGSTLFHGTCEEVQGSLRTGGDGVFWTADSPDIAALYICPGTVVYFHSPESVLDPFNKEDLTQQIRKLLGVSSKTRLRVHPEFDLLSSRSFDVPTPSGFRPDEEVTYAFDQAIPDMKRLILELRGDLKDVEGDEEETEDILSDIEELKETLQRILRRLDLNQRKDDLRKIKMLLSQRGFKERRGVYRLIMDEGKLLPPDTFVKGSLYALKVKKNLKVYSFARGESDLTNVQYNNVSGFRKLESKGYDGILIDDYAQSHKMGNVPHLAVGLFPRGLQKVSVLKRYDMTYSEQGGNYPMKGNIRLKSMIRRVASSYWSKQGSFRLSPREKKVIDAFILQREGHGRLLMTDGRSLYKMGIGGEKVAVWRGIKIAITSTESVKSDETIIRYLVKKAGKGIVTFPYQRKDHKVSLRFESEGDAGPDGQYDGTITAFVPESLEPVGVLSWSYWGGYGDGKGDFSVNMIGVNPQYRRSGIATALYKEWFRQERITKRDVREGYRTEDGVAFRSRARLASRSVTDDSGREHKLPRYLYHVTYLKDLDSIQSRGIRAGRGQTFGGGYGGHSSGRVFFAEEDGVDFWFSRYGMLAENKTDTPEDGWWPVVLRVPTIKIVEEFNYDTPGSKDSRSLSVFVEPERGISSNILEVFDPFSGSWTSLNSIDVDHWLDKAQSEGAEEDSYGEDSWIEVDFDYFAP